MQHFCWFWEYFQWNKSLLWFHFLFLNWIAIFKTTGVLGTLSSEKPVVNLFLSITNTNKSVVAKHQLNLKNVLNQYFISLNYASFQHLNKNHIQLKFDKLVKWREAVIRVLLVYLDHSFLFQSLRFFSKLYLESWEFGRKGYFFLKNNRVTNVNNRFLKGVTQNHCLGFLVTCYQKIWGKPGVNLIKLLQG